MNNLVLDISNPKLYSSNDFVKFIYDRSRVKIAYGGRDGGRSYSAAQAIIINMIGAYYCKAVLLRKIHADIKDTQYQTLLEVIAHWKLEQYFHCIKNPLEINCLINGNMILSRGLDRSSKLKSIKNPTIVWAEEADEISFDDYMAVDNSIRSNDPNALLQFIMTLNPPKDKDHWILDYFFQPKKSFEKEDGSHTFIPSTKKDTLILHSTYKDNRYCTKNRRERYVTLSYNAPDYHKSQILGLITEKDEATIFKEWFEKSKFPEKNEQHNYGIAMDFGFTNHPTAILEACIAHGELWVRELCYKTGLVNTTQLIDRPSIEKEFYRLDIDQEQYIYADSAEPKSIIELQDVGYNVIGVEKPAGSIQAGIDKIKAYRVNIVNSPNFKKEFKNYKYKIDKDGNITNEPVDAFNHLCDALRYYALKELMEDNTIDYFKA